MTADQNISYVPEWTQGDRLRKARARTGMTVREFADHIGVSHGTITSAENDARAVRSITIKAWALATKVSAEWLEHGTEPSAPRPPDGGGLHNPAVAALIAEKSGRGSTRGYSTFGPDLGDVA